MTCGVAWKRVKHPAFDVCTRRTQQKPVIDERLPQTHTHSDNQQHQIDSPHKRKLLIIVSEKNSSELIELIK